MVEQMSPDEFRWPSGRELVAGLYTLAPQVLESEQDIQFRSGLDDLDYYRGAAVALPSGRKVVLLWYEFAPEPRGIELHIDGSDDPAAARAEAAATIGLLNRHLVWAPDLSPFALASLKEESRTWEGTVYIVYRHDRAADSSPPVVMCEVVWTEDDAKRIVARLSRSADDRSRYYYQQASLTRSQSTE